MSEQHRPQLRLYLTGFVLLAELAHLTWEHFNGGVISHHFLHRSDMPAVSNWWGLLLLPLLTWFLIGRIEKRIALCSGGKEAASRLPAHLVAGFIGSLLFGIMISVSFATHYESIASYLSLGVVLLALLLPVYRAECVLGFVLGMTFTFGAVLPLVFASIIAAGSAIVHFLLRPAVVRLWNLFKRTQSSSE